MSLYTHPLLVVSSGTAGNRSLDEICIVLDGQHRPNYVGACDVSPWADLLNRIRARKPCQRLPACRSKVSDRGFLTSAVLRVVELDDVFVA